MRNAPSNVSSASVATVTATSVDDTSKTASLTINLVQPPTISGSNTPDGQVGVSYTGGNVTATGGVGPYTWAIASGSLPPGLSLSGTGSTVQVVGTPTTANTYSFGVKVTDAGGITATSGTLTITVTAAAPLTIQTSSLASGNVNSTYSETVAATGGLQPYTWSITNTPGAPPVGLSIDATTGKISGTPTGPTGTYKFTVNVQDSQATPASAAKQFSITINAAIATCALAPTGDEAKLNGHYAFFMQGFEGSGTGTPVAIAADFAPDGSGGISGGDLDISNSSGHSHLTINSTNSFYTVGADGSNSGDMGCVQLALSNNTTEVYHFTLGGLSSGSYTKGQIIRFDDTTGTGTQGAGVLLQQTSSAFSTGDASKLSANYAFGMDGIDLTGGHYALGGSFALDKSTGNTSGQFDLDDAGTVPGEQTLLGTISGISATTGRATLTIKSSVYNYNVAAYIVSANEMLAVTTDTLSSTQPILAGRILATGSSFSQSSLSGNYVIHVSGSSNPAATVALGLLTFSAGTGNGTLYEYEGVGSTPKTNSVTNGSYSVDTTTGRVTLSNVGSNPPVLYLTSSSAEGFSAFIIGTDNSAIFGEADASSGTFSTAGLAGKYFYGSEDPSDNTVTNITGVVTVSSAGAITGTQDFSERSSPYLFTGNSIAGASAEITNPNGTGDIDSGSIAITNGSKLFFMVDDGHTPAVIYVLEKQ